jgi:hypothetical protein
MFGAEEARKEQSPQELMRTVELYCDAARSAGVQSRVQMSVSDKTDDKILRTTLSVLADSEIRAVYLDGAEKEPGEKMPKPAQADWDKPPE